MSVGEKAMVLAAGLGTRIRSLDPETPKPLIKVAGKSLIDYTLDMLGADGVSEAVVNVHHKADMLESHLAGRETPKVTISDERGELLETGGGILKALPKLGGEPFFSCNTDAILLGGDPAPSTLRKGWSEETDVLLLLVPLARTSGYEGKGDFSLNDRGQIIDACDGEAMVFTGLQLLRPSLFAGHEVERVSTRAFWQKARDAGRMHGVVFGGDWMHVGDPEGHRIAEARLA
ncbi:nucleotidyltransferase family protein [Parvularcula sp. ZS-1/3]|uniref:Nucleotidyltransferase family protein n=1 Tax=Parvularcula mediterranea TaxID=2732508 RepID=A0A7Y3RL46_9PROT|nr:nucleotidyltransferase family protein [Parvularcula mediterranea]NNU16094.1 nucleotidyltransferase family protein [Parvularcula mediterranea]